MLLSTQGKTADQASHDGRVAELQTHWGTLTLHAYSHAPEGTLGRCMAVQRHPGVET